MEKIAIVTGGTGFIGSHLVELLHKNEYTVVVPVRTHSDTSRLPSDVIRIEAAMDNLEPLIPYIEKAELIFHLAGLTRAGSDEELFNVNSLATADLMYLVSIHLSPKLKRFVLASSQAASAPSICDGDFILPVDESEECNPISRYGKSKCQAETIARGWNDSFPITIVRPPSVYGPRDKDIFVYFKLANMGLLPILGDPSRAFSIIHVEDLAKAFYFAATSPQTVGEIFFAANCEPVTWDDFAYKMRDTVHKITGKKPIVFRLPIFFIKPLAWISSTISFFTNRPPLLSKEKLHEMSYSWVCDSSKICNLGYSTEIPLEQGLTESYRWYKNNHWL